MQIILGKKISPDKMSDEALIRKLVADGDGNVLCYNSSKGHLKLLTYQRYNKNTSGTSEDKRICQLFQLIHMLDKSDDTQK